MRWQSALVLFLLIPTPPAAGRGDEPALAGRPLSSWMTDLSDRDPHRRCRAAAALAIFGPEAKAAAPTLVRLAGDPDTITRSAALRALASVDPAGAETVPLLEKGLGDRAFEVRWAAVDGLGRAAQSADAAVPVLARALDDRAVRGIAAKALGRLGPRAAPAIPALAPRADEADSRVGASVPPLTYTDRDMTRALGRIGTAAVPDLIRRLGDRDTTTRIFAIDALSEIGPPAKAAVPALILAMHDRDFWVWLYSTTALGRIGPGAAAAVPELIAGLERARDVPAPDKGPDAGDRPHDNPNIIDTLCRIGGPAIPALTEAVVRRANERAAEGLARLGTAAAEAAPALREALHDKDPEVRAAAVALSGVDPKGPQTLPALIASLKDEGEAADRRSVIEALARMGPAARGAIPTLIERASHAEFDEVRKESLWALGQIDPTDAAVVPALVRALEDQEGEERLLAADILGQIGPPAAASLPTLLRLLKEDPSPEIIEAIGEMGPEAAAAVPALIEVLRRRDLDEVEAAASEALARIGPAARPAIPFLIDAFRRNAEAKPPSDSFVAAARALGTFGPAARDAVPALQKAIEDQDGLPPTLDLALLRIDPRSLDLRRLADDVNYSPQFLLTRLDAAVGHGNRVVEAEARDTLDRLRQLVGSDLLFQGFANRNARRNGIRYTLERLADLGHGADPAVPYLTGLLTNREPSIRRSAAATLDLLRATPRMAPPAPPRRHERR
jgi:HEAT repeat protein